MSLTRELIEIAGRYEAETGKTFYHLNSKMGAGRYVRDALMLKQAVEPGAVVLDLGSGCGQMSYLLKRIGMNVVSTDLFPNVPYFVNYYNKKYEVGKIDYHVCNLLEQETPHTLSERQFDAICISGVLEHVEDFSLFLRRIRRFLKKNGKLFIFRFPNRYSWIEKINDLRSGNTVAHPLRFTLQEVHFMLRWHGFRVDKSRYEEIFPVNVNGLPRALAVAYHKLNVPFMACSRILCNMPVLNKLSTSFRLITTKANL